MGTKRGKKQPKFSPLKPQHAVLADGSVMGGHGPLVILGTFLGA
jgi:hypothetical protein